MSSRSGVARRWLMLCPARRDADRQPITPTEPELNMIRNDPKKLASIRSRLSDISWWMRLLSQNIAQRANKDDKEVGKFWQARYRSVRLIDETAVLACAAYVDLNPIRAAMAETIEESDYTSAQKRAADLARRRGVRGGTSGGSEKSGGDERSNSSEQSGRRLAPCRSRGRHLAPVDLRERNTSPGPNPNKQGTRCSNKGFLPMSTADYLMLLDWTARQKRPDKRGSTPKELAPIFRRLGIAETTWLEMVQNFGRLFSVVAGQPKHVDEFRSKERDQRFHLRKATRDLLA